MAWLTGTDLLWRGLRLRRLLLVSGTLLLLLLLSGQILPQLPGQLNGDPTAASRWLVGASTEYGTAGELLRGLGLFNVVHSFLLQFLLAVLTLILCVYLGDLSAAAFRIQQLPHLLTTRVDEPGAPLMVPSALMLYRRRQAITRPPDGVVTDLHSFLASHFQEVIHAVLPTEAAELPVTDGWQEHRLLALRDRRWVFVRPALMTGLLLAVLVVWRIVIAGWEVAVPLLAPGGDYRSADHGIGLHYKVSSDEPEAAPQLAIQIDAAQTEIPASGWVTTRVAGVDVMARPTLPGLYITAVGDKPILVRAGQSDKVAGIGLSFPGPGSEESIILPDQAIGLRIVRLSDEVAASSGAGFLLEVYRGEDAQPAKRVEIGANAVETVVVDNAGLTLRFMRLPGLEVQARFLPGLWWLWVALALTLFGAVGFWYRPSFVLAQIAPWLPEGAVVTLQSDDSSALSALSDQVTG